MATATLHPKTQSNFVDLMDTRLSENLTLLREAALYRHSRDDNFNTYGSYSVPTRGIIDARAWRNRGDNDDWLIWRANRTAARLRGMPIDVSPGELIVGRPELRNPTAEEEIELRSLDDVRAEIPEFPGGDAGHFQPDYDTLFSLGIDGMLKEIEALRDGANTNGKSTFYQACYIAMEALSDYCIRVAEASEAIGNLAAAEVCRAVAHRPPETLREAMQLQFLTLVALWFAEDHGLTCPGRMDQNLRGYYEADIAAGRITEPGALELICALYIQLNMILVPGSALAVMVGGRYGDGSDVTNGLTYLCLIARYITRLVYPTVGLAWHSGMPSELVDFACRIIATGVGDPAFFNDEVISAGLREHGVSKADSHNYMNSTCVEIKPVGTSHIWVTAPYFNCPDELLGVIRDVTSGTVSAPSSFNELSGLVKERFSKTIRETAVDLDRTWKMRGETGCFPLGSCLIKDCLKKGIDFDRGGARYNWVENSFVGLGNLADSLMAVKHLVYDTGEYTVSGLGKILEANFVGYESLQKRMVSEIPKYGNNDDEVDRIATEWAEFLMDATEGCTVGLHRYVPGFFCWIVHEQYGNKTGATPDGRTAGFPLADGAGAVQGNERSGPTSSILSTTKWGHKRAIGGLVHNLKLSGNTITNNGGRRSLRALIETYLQRGGFEIQVNVVGVDKLREAQKHPEQYSDLLVRVAGYSDYFVHLNANMQEEVIRRTEFSL